MPSGENVYFLTVEWHEDVSVGVLPGVDVGAHRAEVPVRRGDCDGQLSPRGQRWSAQPGASHSTCRHFLSSQPERVKHQPVCQPPF